MNRKIVITSGDIDGVGYEVSAKALLTHDFQDSQFILWRHPQADPSLTALLKNKFSYTQCTDLSAALKSQTTLTEVISSDSPALWVEQSAKACLQGHARALVTGPLSKTEIYKSGLTDMGHTDILKRISGVSSVHMSFFGEHFNVALTSAHIPVSQVPAVLTKDYLEAAVKNCAEFIKKLPSVFQDKPIGILGLNPHAGEEGLIGKEEQTLFTDLSAWEKKYEVSLKGPLVPDAAFLRSQWEKFSIYLALYHDQGLIPFKTIHGQDSGAHITLGIPFIRTSVDHGTAKDIFGLDKANPHSMIDAIRWAIRLS